MAGIVSFKCPNCDGDLRFSPKDQKYTCEWCGSVFDQAFFDQMSEETAANATEEEPAPQAENASEAGEENQGGKIYSCPSCGAEVVTDETTAATFCYYCHNPVVLSGRLSGKLLPDFVIPFQIPKEEAVDRFIKFTKKKWFIPRNFFDAKQVENLTGVYFPYWLGEGDFDGTAQAEAQKIRKWVSGDYEYTEVKTFHVEREGEIKLKNWLGIALSKTNQILAEGVQPYDFKAMKPFSYGYLTGFQAEKRDIEREPMEERARTDLRSASDSMLKDSMKGYSSVTKFNSSYTKEDVDLKYVLLPIWTMTYPGKKDKVYFYSMNAQTGKVIGDFPVSEPKALLFAVVISVVLLLLFLLGGWLI